VRTRLFFGVATAVAVAGLPLGCSSAKTVGAGGDCFQATDCAPGLVCVPVKVGGEQRVCTNDLTNIVSTEDAAADGAARPAGDAGSDGAQPPKDGGGDAAPPPADAGGD